MGWFDDNHPMGQAAQDEADEIMGYNKWYRDPMPASSSRTRETPRVERPEAEWDETKWRKSNFREDETIPKTKAKTFYLLTDKDLLPLEYRKEMNSAGYNNMKCYRKREVEHLSWQKHGGPNGLKAAKAEKKANPAPSRGRKVAGKGMTLEQAVGNPELLPQKKKARAKPY